MATSMAFSELIAPQGNGRGTTSSSASGNLYSYQLYSPPTEYIEPKPPVQDQIVKPVQVVKPPPIQPKPIVVEQDPDHMSELSIFPEPTTTVLHGDGSDSAFWYNLPVPTRMRTKQISLDGAEGALDDFFITEGMFELVMGVVGGLEVRLDAYGYAQQFTLFTARQPVPEEAEE